VFFQGDIFTSERYAFDSTELNDDFNDNCSGDRTVNTNYFNYNSPLLAVADGTVVFVQDGLPENHGDRKDVVMHSLLDYGGNFVILDIGGGRYAFYCHCIPGSITVNAGDSVHEGDEIARLGNSGNSGEPHLHFQISDGPDVFFSHGIPFVLKEYTKTGDVFATPPSQTPEHITNSMMEEFTIFNMD
jgi:murein DD-endopeptidase MepM/ murein hydrolase activator NlpD